MAGKAISVVVLVCPQCGKKYKGDANKPDARYQCPADQSSLIRLDTEAVAAVKQAKAEGRQEIANSNANAAAMAASPQVAVQAAAAFSAAAAGQGAASVPDMPAPPALMGYSTPYATPGDVHPAAPDNGGPPPPPDYGHETSYIPPPGAAHSAPAQDYAPPPTPQASVEVRPAPRAPTGTNILSGFEQRRSVVATLERLGGTDPATGQRVSVFKYETKSKLGAGGMGEVYKVLDRDLRREVAMKMLRPQAGAGVEETDLLRFVKEAQATGRLEHPNIVPVHDLGVDGEGRIYFTLKYVKGVSLKEVIRGRRDATALEDK